MTTFIDGDFPSGAECSHHFSPSCHPCQDGGESGTEWVYGCLHKAWPQNRAGDFCPIVNCGGDPTKCDMRGKKFVSHYRRGLTVRQNNTENKAAKIAHQLIELDALCKP